MPLLIESQVHKSQVLTQTNLQGTTCLHNQWQNYCRKINVCMLKKNYCSISIINAVVTTQVLVSISNRRCYSNCYLFQFAIYSENYIVNKFIAVQSCYTLHSFEKSPKTEQKWRWRVNNSESIVIVCCSKRLWLLK